MQPMNTLLLILFTLLLLTACNSQPLPSAERPAQSLVLENDKLRVAMRAPQGWTSLEDDRHLILVEKPNPINANGLLEGLIVHIWMPTLEDLLEINFTPTSSASELLQQIVELPLVTANAVASTPQAFQASGYDGAYYTLNSGDGNVTFVLMLKYQDSNFVAFNVSTQLKQLERIPQGLVQVLGGMTFNGVPLDTAWVARLPSVLYVPSFKTEAAMEASPASP